MKKIRPKIISPEHKLMKCLYKDADIVLNYLSQYYEPFKDTNYIAPLKIGRWKMITEHIKAMYKHIQEMEKKHYMVP